jgi:hypothetical protein
MTAFLLQNLKLILLFFLIGSVIGLANIGSVPRILRTAIRLPMSVH